MQTVADHTEILRSSEKFQAWRRAPARRNGRRMLMAEKHYSANELATLWDVSAQTIRNIFKDEPGVLRIQNGNGKRDYVTIRIPLSVAERVHRRLSALPQ
jgi:hypothetical protein